MREPDIIDNYCDQVCGQIRWKKARAYVRPEIEGHLLDQMDAYLSAGDSKATAAQKAILQMGDAVSIGTALDKTHRPKPQWSLIALTGFLMFSGALANSYLAARQYGLRDFSILPFAVSFAVLVLCYFADFTLLGRYAVPVYTAVLLVSGLAVLTAGRVNGSSSWIAGPFSISLKCLSLVYPLAYALLVYAMRSKGFPGILFCGLGYLPPAFLLMCIPTISGLLLFTLSALLTLCWAIAKGWFQVPKKKGLCMVLLPALLAGAAGLLAVPNLSFRFQRVLDPYSDRTGSGYQFCLIRDMMAGSKWIGRGQLPDTWESLPPLLNFDTDYILAILTYHQGRITFLVIAAALSIFAVLGLRRLARQKSVLGTLVALSVLSCFVLQAAGYIISNMGYGFVSPLSLPFISYGSTARIVNAALVGFMLSVFRTGDVFTDKNTLKPEKHTFFTFRDGKMIIDFKG